MCKQLRVYRRPACSVLAISDSNILASILTPGNPFNTEYPDVDLCSLPYEDGEFDMVVAGQVLEHVRDPAAAVSESVRVTRPGGLVVLTTCCVNPIHGRPDYFRFTPDGLALLVPEGAEVLETGGWGNPFMWLVVALGARFVPVPHAKWHPLHWLATWNHPDWPVVTWIVIKRE
jgi:SAM-dependent methyltransferase